MMHALVVSVLLLFAATQAQAAESVALDSRSAFDRLESAMKP